MKGGLEHTMESTVIVHVPRSAPTLVPSGVIVSKSTVVAEASGGAARSLRVRGSVIAVVMPSAVGASSPLTLRRWGWCTGAVVVVMPVARVIVTAVRLVSIIVAVAGTVSVAAVTVGAMAVVRAVVIIMRHRDARW